MKKYLLFLVAFSLVFAGAAHGDFYTWEDENGITQITDYPPPETQQAQKIKVHKIADPSSIQKDEQAAQAVQKPDIILYTKNNCADCDKARTFLQSANLTFTEYNMDMDEAAVERRKAIDNSDDVPFAIINKNQVYGFSETVYNRALKPTP